MNKVKWGIIGPGKIANRFADGLHETSIGELVAIASKSDERRKSFGDKYNIIQSFRYNDYEEILLNKEVNAIYIALPHTLHSEWSIKSAKNNKSILCEKPACINFAEGMKTIDQIKTSGVFYMEGFMYRCHPQIKKLISLIKSNIIGKINSIKASFGFNAGNVGSDSRLFDIKLAGGAILDVGLYTISFSRLVAGADSGLPFLNPYKIEGSAKIGKTGVDEEAYAKLFFENEIIAEVQTSITLDMDNKAVIEGSKGSIILDNPWQPGKEGGPYECSIIVEHQDKKNNKIYKLNGPEHLFFFEAQLVCESIINGKKIANHPAMTWDDTLGNLKTLDNWRKVIGYKLPFDNL